MKFDSSSLKGQSMSRHDNFDMCYISGERVHLLAASFMLTLSKSIRIAHCIKIICTKDKDIYFL